MLDDKDNLGCVHLQVSCAFFMDFFGIKKLNKKEKIMIKDCNQLVKRYEVEN